MTSQTYAPNTEATVTVQVMGNGSPVSQARFTASFAYPGKLESCSGTTDATGGGFCSTPVPIEPNGTVVDVSVEVIAPSGGQAQASASFTVQRA
jgi:hypothetical protein